MNTKERIDIAKSNFFISGTVNFTSKEDCFSTKFYTPIPRNTGWKLTFVRTIQNTSDIYLTFHSKSYDDKRKEIEVRCNFYVVIQTKQREFRSELISKEVICPWNKDVCIYIGLFVSTMFDFDIRGTINEVFKPFPTKIEAIPAEVLKNFESLLLNEKLCDVTLITSNGSHSAHKIILASQSPVFERMFSSDMKEKMHGIAIKMENIEDIVLKEMLRFMYGGRVENIDNIADKLLILANRYEIQPLMTLCEKVLYDKLTIDNAISTIKIADIHNAPKLRSLTEDFIIKNKNDLIDTAEFKSFILTNPQIVIDILKAN